jgi:DNA-binding IclR family transcriptional regulator
MAAPIDGMAAGLAAGTVKSADRTVELLELLAAADRGLTLTELHRELNWPKSSLFMLLQTLVARRWVEADASRTSYRLGVRALLIGVAYLDHDAVAAVAAEPLDRLRDRLGSPCHLVRLDGAEVVCVAGRGEPGGGVDQPAGPRVGGRLPAFAVAAGKILLAQRGWAEVDALLPPMPRPLTRRTVTSRAALRAQLAQFAAAGFAVEHGEVELDLAGFAVPVPYRSPATDALGCAVPLRRLTGPRSHQVLLALHAAARQLTARLRADRPLAAAPPAPPRPG